MPALGSALTRPPRYGIGAAAVPFRPDLPTYVRITDIDEFGRFAPDPAVSVDSPLSANFQLSEGEIVVARTGASVGKSYRYIPPDGPLVFAGFLIALVPDSTLLDPRYLSYYFQSKPYWNWITSESMRSGQPGINARQLALMPIDAPSVEQQRDIANRLQDVDDLIASIEHLIAKKRALKQGLMQELLTGRSRLPGFDDQWRDIRLGELGSFLKGRGIKRDQVRPTGVPCIRYGELYTAYTGYTETTLSFVEPSIAATALPIHEGDILLAGSGETKEEIGMSVAYIGDTAAVAGGDIIVLRGSSYDPVFLASLLNSPSVAAQKARGGQGDAVVHINSRVLAAIGLRVPELAEQQEIASVIRDADAETAVLERRLEVARDVKQGMMQELLTGRTRLSVEGDAA